MRTVVARLRFTTPCLGNRKDSSRGGMLCHLRDAQSRVVFLQSWWDSALVQTAQAYGRHQSTVRKIRWSPIVDGCTRVHKRYYKKDKYRKHEAFDVGDEIAVKAMVPTDIPIAEFRVLLSVLGEFYGISPFRRSKSDGKDQGGYGRFEVVEVKEHEYKYHDQKSEESPGDQPGRTDPAPADSSDNVQAIHPELREEESE